jgi:hypothetical protein
MVVHEPTLVLLAASRELEDLVAISERGEDDVLLDVTRSGELGQWNLGQAIAANKPGRNPILDRAWDSYPFRKSDPHVVTACRVALRSLGRRCPSTSAPNAPVPRAPVKLRFPPTFNIVYAGDLA